MKETLTHQVYNTFKSDLSTAIHRNEFSAKHFHKNAELLISSRLHGLVYATAAACPMLGYSDDGKLFSYLDYIGFGCEDEVPCGVFVGENADFALECALKILSEREACREKMKKRLPEYRMLAEREFFEIRELLK